MIRTAHVQSVSIAFSSAFNGRSFARVMMLCASFAMVACGGGGGSPDEEDAAVDAHVSGDATTMIDSGPKDSGTDSHVTPIDSGTDAGQITTDAGTDAGPTCAFTTCGPTCVNTATSVDHCGTCPVSCVAGQACLSNSCGCPANFLPSNRTRDASDLAFPGATANEITVVASISDSLGLHGLLMTYNTSTTQLNQAYTLTTAGASSVPYVAATFRVSAPNENTDASFIATAGSLTFTSRCAGGATGTLTGATFSAAVSDVDPTLVVGGCSFAVPSMTFQIGTACP